MNNLFTEIRRVLVALWNMGVTGGVNAWAGANIAARWVILITVGWPVLMIVAALFGITWITAIVSFLPIIAIVILLFIWDHTAVAGVLATFNHGRAVLRGILGVLGAELAIGLYSSVVPMSNRRELIPLLVLASAMLFIIIMSEGKEVKWKAWAKRGAWVVFFAVTLSFFFPRASRKVWSVVDRIDAAAAGAMDGPTAPPSVTLRCGINEYIPLKKEVTLIVPPASGLACQTGWVVRPYKAPGFIWDVVEGKLDIEERFDDGTTVKFVDLVPIDPNQFTDKPIMAFRFTNRGSVPVPVNIIMK